MDALRVKIRKEIKETHVLIYSKTTCPYCDRVKRLFDVHCVAYTAVELDQLENGADYKQALTEETKQGTVPNVFINGHHIGGCDSLLVSFSKGIMTDMLLQGQQERDGYNDQHPYDYDLIVLGGGSGGLACAKEAATLCSGVVCCLDYVKPTPLGTMWGLGGTCVNVGCIPKKLMHQAALLGQAITDARDFGWSFSEGVSHEWGKMIQGIQDHIGSLNWGYKNELRSKSVKYLNSLGEFVDAHTIKHTNKSGKSAMITGARIVVAVGGRPRYPDIPGAREYGITSDDLFSLATPPGKTLVVGASYVALECAGFLAGIGFDTTCMVRSIFLRGFDQQMADKAAEYMIKHGVKFMIKTVPTKVELVSDGTPKVLHVHYKNLATNKESFIEVNTVLFAIGRDPDTKTLGLDKAEVQVTKSGHIPTVYEQTNIPNIYAIGDVQKGKLELTPLAIQAGKLLARRLFSGSKVHCDYVNIPTTVFTPLEYGCIGLAEEDAELIFGKTAIEVYHINFQPLEWTVPGRAKNDCYMKLVINKNDNERVVGFHYLGPNGGEVTQGFTLGMKLGATKADFDNIIGIHPTCAEGFTTLSVTKSSGASAEGSGC